MSIIFAGGLAMAMLILQPAPQASPGQASDAAKLDPNYWNPRYWHDRVASEQRDSQWAPGAEAAVRARLTQLAGLDTPQHPLTVRCARTACEASGEIVGSDSEKSAMLEKVQDVAAKSLPGAPPLTIVSFSVTISEGAMAMGYLIHFRRDVAPS